MPLDPKQLPRDVNTLQKIILDLAEQLDRSQEEQNKYQSLLRELLEAQRNRKSERLSQEQFVVRSGLAGTECGTTRGWRGGRR